MRWQDENIHQPVEVGCICPQSCENSLIGNAISSRHLRRQSVWLGAVVRSNYQEPQVRKLLTGAAKRLEQLEQPLLAHESSDEPNDDRLIRHTQLTALQLRRLVSSMF